MDKKEALKALKVIQAGMIRTAEMCKDIPQVSVPKNQKSSSAKRREREKSGASRRT